MTDLGEPDVTMLFRLGESIDLMLNGEEKPKRVAFVLLVTSFDEPPGRVDYVSNSDRNDVIALLTEVLARFEGRIT